MKYDVYKIECDANGKIYFGRSQELEKRWRAHRNMLRSNTHRNLHLQEDWNIYGEHSFEFEVLETFSDLELSVAREQELIESNLGVGYNIGGAMDGGDRMLHNPRREETLKLKSEVFSGKGNPMYGRPKSQKMIDRVKEVNSKRVSIEGTEYPSVAEAIRMLGLNPSTAYFRVKSDSFPEWFYIDDKCLTTISEESRLQA